MCSPTTSSSSTSNMPNIRKKQKPCKDERECWTVFIHVCELSLTDLEKIRALDYTTTTRLSMFGLYNNIHVLLEAGISHAKAHMILLFATFVLHCKQNGGTIPKNLTFDKVLEFNFKLSNMESNSAGNADAFTTCSADTMPDAQSKGSKGSSRESSKGSKSRGRSPKKNTRKNNSSKKNNGRSKKNKKVSWKQTNSSGGGSELYKPFRRASYGSESLQSIPESIAEDSSDQEDCLEHHHPHHCQHHHRDSVTTKQTCEELTLDAPSVCSSLGGCRWGASSIKSGAETSSLNSSKVRRPMRQASVEDLTGGDGMTMDRISEASLDESATLEETSSHKTPLLETTVPTPLQGEEQEHHHHQEEDCTNLILNMDMVAADYVAPKSPWERSTLKWAVALDVDEELTDSDDYSDSDSDDWDSDDESSSSSCSRSESSESDEDQVFRWKTQNVTLHELTLPANKVLPVRLQDLFRQAANNPELDIQQQINQALGSVPVAPPAARSVLPPTAA